MGKDTTTVEQNSSKDKAEGDWVVQESKSYAGRYYRYNPNTQQSEWVTGQPSNQPPVPAKTSTDPKNGGEGKADNIRSKVAELSGMSIPEVGPGYVIPSKCIIGTEASSQPRATTQKAVPSLPPEVLRARRRSDRPHTAGARLTGTSKLRSVTLEAEEKQGLTTSTASSAAAAAAGDKGDGDRESEVSGFVGGYPGPGRWSSNDTISGSECICTICECGQHACPVQRASVKFVGGSRYREDYPGHPASRVAAKGSTAGTAGEVLFPANAAEEYISQYDRDYIPLASEPRTSMKPTAASVSKCPFSGTTTYGEMLSPPKSTKRPALMRPMASVKPRIPFEGTTTMMELFPAYSSYRPSESLAPPPAKLSMKPFEGRTTYKATYESREQLLPTKRMVPITKYEYGPPRNLETEHRVAYTEKKATYCPVFDLLPQKPSVHTGHVHYTKKNRPEYKYYPGKPALLCRGKRLNAE